MQAVTVGNDASGPAEAPGRSMRPALLVHGLHAAFVAVLLVVADYWLVKEPLIGTVAVPLFTLSAAAAVWFGRAGAAALVEAGRRAAARLDGRAAIVACVGLLAILLAVAFFVFDTFANSADEYALVLQAETFTGFRLWVDPPPLRDAFRLIRFIDTDTQWISAYYPGWPAVMAAGKLVGLPLWTMSPIIGVLLLVVYYVLAKEVVGKDWAALASLAVVSSAFFLLNLATYFPHGFATLCGAAFVLAGLRCLERDQARWALAAGASIGFLGVARPFNAAIFAAPFVVALLLKPRLWRHLIWFGLAGVPFFLAFTGYNAAVTGNPLQAVQSSLQGEPFGESVSALAFTFWRAVRLTVWSSPVLQPAWLVAFGWLAWKRRLDFSDFIFPATVGAFLFYGGDGGLQYGPRYLFEAWPFMVLTAVKALALAWPDLPSRRRELVASVLVAHIAFQAAYAAPRLWREARITDDRQDLYTEAGRLTNAVVFIAGDSGTIRPMVIEDLPRNGLVVGDESVTYALDRGPKNQEVMAVFPGRRGYVYRNGALTPIAPPATP
jgi:hypothetical protein